jgi:hypothetical protein
MTGRGEACRCGDSWAVGPFTSNEIQTPRVSLMRVQEDKKSRGTVQVCLGVFQTNPLLHRLGRNRRLKARSLFRPDGLLESARCQPDDRG